MLRLRIVSFFIALFIKMSNAVFSSEAEGASTSEWTTADEAVTAATFSSLLEQLPDDLKAALLREALATCGPACLVGLERERDAILYAASRQNPALLRGIVRWMGGDGEVDDEGGEGADDDEEDDVDDAGEDEEDSGLAAYASSLAAAWAGGVSGAAAASAAVASASASGAAGTGGGGVEAMFLADAQAGGDGDGGGEGPDDGVHAGNARYQGFGGAL